MRNHGLVSIITPIYCCEAFLAECIESVLGQTYTHWEMIIVDDCSDDEPVEIIKRFAHRDERI